MVPAAGGRIVRGDRDFTADPARAEFDEPQIYHHAWRALEWFRALTDPPLLTADPFAPMRILVRDPGSPDNAYYSPDTGDLHFGMFGERSNARDASVVIHELGHAVSDAICRLGRSFTRDTEARGLSEGFSDYFAASLLDDPRLGPFIADDPEGARNAADPGLRFPPGFRGEEHDLGAVWAAVLWGLRGRAGAATRTGSWSSRSTSSGRRARSRRPGRPCTPSTTASSAAATARRSTTSSTRAPPCRSVASMRIEVHQRGGVLGLDRRCSSATARSR